MRFQQIGSNTGDTWIRHHMHPSSSGMARRGLIRDASLANRTQLDASSGETEKEFG
jgi:hypothetical protein